MEELKQWLDSQSYQLLIGNIDPRSQQFPNWLNKNIDVCMPEEKVWIIRFLFLSQAIPLEIYNQFVPVEVQNCLLAKELVCLCEDKKHIYLRGLQLNVVDGLYVLAQPLSINQTIYFGEDSLGLVRNHPYISDKDVLDLCCGPGTQGLSLARRNNRVVGIDINPMALRIAKINAEINGLNNSTSFELRDVRTLNLDNRRFDYICMNPPLIPVVPGFNLPLVAGGGVDGLSITTSVIKNLPNWLKPGGVFRTLGTTYTSNGTPIILKELEDLAKSCELKISWVTVAESNLKYDTENLSKLVKTYSLFLNIPEQECKTILLNYFEKNDIENYASYFMQVESSCIAELEYIDYGDYQSNSCWSIL